MRKFTSVLTCVLVCLTLLPLYTNCTGGFGAALPGAASGSSLGDSYGPPQSAATGWHPLKIGAGGWLTGLDISNDGSTKVVRTDTAGAYIWDPNQMHWNLMTPSSAMPAADVFPGDSSYVYELRVAPNLPTRLYMATLGRVYRSDDRGAHWSRTSLPTGLNIDGGTPERMSGQKMAVDPQNADVVYLGTISNGLLATFDGGVSWQTIAGVQSVAGNPQGISGLVIDSGQGLVAGRSKIVYASGSGQGVYRSTDGGITFTLLPGGPTTKIAHAKLAPDGAYYAVSYDQVGGPGRIWRFEAGAWTDLTPDNNSYWSVVTDPSNANRLIAVTHGGGISVSENRGASFSGVLNATRTALDVAWLAWTSEGYMSTGDMMLDPKNPKQLWFAEGIGVWMFELPSSPVVPSAVVWASRSAGIEQLVANTIVTPPQGHPLLGSWDRPVFRVDNPDVYPSQHGPDNQEAIRMGWSVDYASSNPNFIVALINWGSESSSYSQDGGLTWSRFASAPPFFANGKIGGSIAASTPQNIAWFPNNNGTPYFTKDGGQTWTQATFPGQPSGSESGWGWGYFFKRQIVAADRVLPNTFYAYNYLTGLYRSQDGGSSWALVSPRIFTFSGYHAKLRSVPGHAGHLFFTAGTQGGVSDPHPAGVPFSHSTDGGATWVDFADVREVLAFGFGKAAAGTNYPTLFIAGWVKNDYGIFRSFDEGQTWEKLGDYPNGNLDAVVALDGDLSIFGRVYVGFGGSGYAYGQFN